MNGTLEIVDWRVPQISSGRLAFALRVARQLLRLGISIDLFRQRAGGCFAARRGRALLGAVAMPLVSVSARLVGLCLERECCRLQGACSRQNSCALAATDVCPRRSVR